MASSPPSWRQALTWTKPFSVTASADGFQVITASTSIGCSAPAGVRGLATSAGSSETKMRSWLATVISCIPPPDEDAAPTLDQSQTVPPALNVHDKPSRYPPTQVTLVHE